MVGFRKWEWGFGAAFGGLVLLVLTSCSEAPTGPIAGLHSAAAAVHVVTEKEPRSLIVGSELKAGDRLEATGPAVIEYFGGAVLFLEAGDRITVGKRQEAKLRGSNLEELKVQDADVVDAPRLRRIIAARYRSASFTPQSAGRELGTGDYLKAFFTPNGIANLGRENGQLPEGPRRALPPPPHRAPVPHIHAADPGQGGPILEVEDGYVAVETPQLATAILLEDQRYELGGATRLLLPEGAEATLELLGGKTIELEGPADVQLQ